MTTLRQTSANLSFQDLNNGVVWNNGVTTRFQTRWDANGFNFRFRSNSSGIMTFPNAATTLAGLSISQTWTATQTMQHVFPSTNATYDLGDNATPLRWRHLYLSGNLSDGTNSLTIANAKTAFDHVSADGSSHSFIDQTVVSGASPTFDGANFTGIDISAGTNLAVTSPIVLTDDTISFDFSTNNTWTGTNTFNADVTCNDNLIIDFTDTEAFLVRKNSDGGDIFTVDTTNERAVIGTSSGNGKLEVALLNADLSGYYMRHTADNPSSHDSNFFDIQRTLTGTAATSADVRSAGGFSNSIIDQRDANLSTGFALATNQPFINVVVSTGSISGTPQIFQQANLALTNQVTISGTHTADPQFDGFRMDTYGAFSSVSDESFYTPVTPNYGATFAINAFRGNIGYNTSGALTHGDLTRINQGAWIYIGGTARGADVYNYAYYTDEVNGGTENWNIYNDTAVDNYFGYDNSKSFFGTAKDASIWYDDTDFNFNAGEVGTGGFQWRTAADTDLVFTFNGTTHSGVFTWMEDEDYFESADAWRINSGDSANVAFTVKGASGQSADSFVVTDDSDSTLFSIDAAGNGFFAGAEALQFRDSALGIYSQADTFLDLFADEGVRIGDSSAGAPSNFSKFETDGTLEFNGSATVWKDINVGAAQLSRPSSSQPDEDNFLTEAGADTGITTLAYAVGEKASGSFEMQHDYKEGSDFTFHVHWQGITAPSGTDNVQWRITYVLMRGGTTLDTVTVIDSADTAIDTQYECYRSDVVVIDGATKGNNGSNVLMGDQLLFTIERVASTGDAYAGDALVATMGIHYEVDTVGSRQIVTK